MRLYADDDARRRRQAVGDAVVAAWILLWVLVGRWLHELVQQLGDAGRFLEDAGGDFARSAGGVGEDLEDLPLLGDQLASPFGSVAEGGAAVARAGESQQDAVATLALTLGVTVAILPITAVVVPYAWRRIRWARQSDAVRALLDGTGGQQRLFALRALCTQPLEQLRAVDPDPAGAFERGDPDVVAALADLELRVLGVHAEPAVPTGRRLTPNR